MRATLFARRGLSTACAVASPARLDIMRAMPSMWKRLTEAVRHGVLLERLWARMIRRPNADLERVLAGVFAELRDPVVFECGVCNGEDTRRLCRLLDHRFKAYYAFEPDPRNIAYLKEPGRLPPRVELVEAAVGARDGRAKLFLSNAAGKSGVGKATSNSSICKPNLDALKLWVPWSGFEGEAEVPVRSLDSFCRERAIEHVDFLWADVQGAERHLIAGAAEMLPRIRYLYLEQEGYELYEGQWTWRQMRAALSPRFRVACRFPSNVLLRNVAW